MFLLLLCAGLAVAQQYTPETYPNPKKGGFRACKMRSISSVCDPDEILTESERYRLNNELNRLGSRTEQQRGSFCAKKGIDGVLVIVPEGSQSFVNQLNKNWNSDSQCQKNAIFLLSTNDRHLYYAGAEQSGINPAEFVAIVSAEQGQLSRGQYTAALVNVLKELGKKSNPLEPEEPPKKKDPNAAATIFSISCILLSLFL